MHHPQFQFEGIPFKIAETLVGQAFKVLSLSVLDPAKNRDAKQNNEEYAQQPAPQQGIRPFVALAPQQTK